MVRSDHTRDPCPWVIVSDFGGAFAMGAVCGGIWHSLKGAKNAPRGERLYGSMVAVKARAPVLAGHFAVWGGLFSTFDCCLRGIRQKEDSWNSIMSGALTGGVLAVRGGLKPMLISGAMGGIFLGVIEGVGLVLGRMMTPEHPEVIPMADMAAPSPQ